MPRIKGFVDYLLLVQNTIEEIINYRNILNEHPKNIRGISGE